MLDKGFNPPPSWAAVAGTIANVFPLSNKLTYTILFNLDLLFILTAAILVFISSGFSTGIITTVLLVTYFGTLGTLANNFFQYIWLPFIVISVIFWRKQKTILSGISLCLACAFQAFPMVFAIPVAIFTLTSWLKHQTKQTRSASFFLLSFMLTLLIFFILGNIYTGKTGIWNEWFNKINIQKNYIHGEIFDIGFPTLVAITTSGDHADSYSYLTDYTHTQNRINSFNKNINIWRIAVALVFLFVFARIWRFNQNQPFIYGYLLIYVLLSLSPYYYLILAILPFVFWDYSIIVRRFAIVGTFILFLIHFLLFSNGYISFTYFNHLISQLLILCFFIVLSLLLILDT